MPSRESTDDVEGILDFCAHGDFLVREKPAAICINVFGNPFLKTGSANPLSAVIGMEFPEADISAVSLAYVASSGVISSENAGSSGSSTGNTGSSTDSSENTGSSGASSENAHGV